MKQILIPLCLSILALAVLPASGQVFAPASIPVSSSVSWESTVTEIYGSGPEAPYDESYSLSFTSATTFVVPPYTTGTCAYHKTGDNTATLTYTANMNDGAGFTETEEGTLLMTFTSATGGIFTNSGSFVSNFGGISDPGTFTSIGTFTYSPTLVFTLPPVSDDFNDNIKDTAKWGADVAVLPGGALTESGQRLNYSISSGDGAQQRPWILNPPRYDQDWQVVVDVAGSFGLSGSLGDSPFSRIGLDISIPGIPFDYVGLNFTGFDNGTNIEWGVDGYIAGGANLIGAELASGQSALRVSFNSTTKVLTCFYDPDGPQNGYAWLEMGSFGINGSGGTTDNDSWGLTGSEPFQVSLYGFSNNRTIPLGSFYADNFRISSGGTSDVPLQAWQRLYFGDPNSPDAALAFDKDKDGLKNLIEYAFKLEPQVPGTPILTTLTGTSGLPRITPVGSGPTQRLRLEFVRMKASFNPGITYVPQFSSNLQSSGTGGWTNASGSEIKEDIDTQWERVTIEDTTGTGLPNRFGRVRVSAP